MIALPRTLSPLVALGLAGPVLAPAGGALAAEAPRKGPEAVTRRAGTAEEALPLPAAIARGLAAHPRLRAARRQVEAARAREVQAAAGPNPNLAVAIDQVPFANPAAGNYMAGVTQPLLPAALREAQLGVARADREIAEAGLAIERQDLAARIKDAYAHALYEAAGQELARDTADHARWLASAARGRWKAGDVPRADVLRAEVDLARAERDQRVAEGALADARARLNVLLGRPAQAPLLLGPLPAPARAPLPAVDALVARALAGRVEFRRAALQVEREALQRRAALAAIWTGTEVGAAFGAVSGAPGFSTTLALPIPIYRREGEAAEAEAARLRAEAEREALAHEVTLEVEQARRAAVLAADLAGRYAKDYVPRARTLADNARARFRAGEGSGAELAEAEHALHEVRAEHQRAVLDWHEAVAKLERAIGAEAVEVPR